jgi:hypothetical protein
MRDGIYKNLALSAPVRAILKSCTLDAERGQIAQEKCERAAGIELRNIEPLFRKSFREKCDSTELLLPGFSAFPVDVTSTDLGGQNSPLANQILAQARHLERAGLKGADLERSAYAGAIGECMDAHRRSIEQTILAERPDAESKATIAAARNAFESTPSMHIVDELLAGALHLPPAQRRVNLDEDISRTTP